MPDTKTKTTDDKVIKSEEQWRRELSPMQYAVLREKATERPFSGEYEHDHRAGTYVCAGCGNVLFESDAKFDSGCGWPSFTQPAVESHIDEEHDASHGMIRTEVLCSKCSGHLGHVFPDGPGPDRPALLHQLGRAEARAEITLRAAGSVMEPGGAMCFSPLAVRPMSAVRRPPGRTP